MRFFLIFILLVSTYVPIPVVAERPSYFITAVENVEMRTTASEDGKTIAMLPKGTKVVVTEQKANWTRIELNGRLGWLPGDALTPFTENLWEVYAAYYRIVQQTDNVVYALLADFTQDGVEDLYVVIDTDATAGDYTEIIYSREQVIYEQLRTDGLTILQDGMQYIIRHDGTINQDVTFALSELNLQARTDYYDMSDNDERYGVKMNAYAQMVHFVEPAAGHVQERTFISEEMTSKDFFGAELVNHYNENVYLQRRAEQVNGKEQKLTEVEFKEALKRFSSAKTVVTIYDDQYKSAVATKFRFQKQRLKAELLERAKAYEPVVETQLADEELRTLREQLIKSLQLELPFLAGERNQQQMVKQVLSVQPIDGEVQLTQEEVAKQVRDFYGVKLDEHLEVDGAELVDGRYVTTQPPRENQYRQLVGVEQLTKTIVAVPFVDYQLPQEVVVAAEREYQLIAGEQVRDGYVIFKRVNEQWLYIDTVDTAKGIDLLFYETYVNGLAEKEMAPVAQQFIAEPVAVERTEPQLNIAQQKPQPITASILIIFCVIILSFGLAYVLYVYKYKEGRRK